MIKKQQQYTVESQAKYHIPSQILNICVESNKFSEKPPLKDFLKKNQNFQTSKKMLSENQTNSLQFTSQKEQQRNDIQNILQVRQSPEKWKPFRELYHSTDQVRNYSNNKQSSQSYIPSTDQIPLLNQYNKKKRKQSIKNQHNHTQIQKTSNGTKNNFNQYQTEEIPIKSSEFILTNQGQYKQAQKSPNARQNKQFSNVEKYIKENEKIQKYPEFILTNQINQIQVQETPNAISNRQNKLQMSVEKHIKENDKIQKNLSRKNSITNEDKQKIINNDKLNLQITNIQLSTKSEQDFLNKIEKNVNTMKPKAKINQKQSIPIQNFLAQIPQQQILILAEEIKEELYSEKNDEVYNFNFQKSDRQSRSHSKDKFEKFHQIEDEKIEQKMPEIKKKVKATIYKNPSQKDIQNKKNKNVVKEEEIFIINTQLTHLQCNQIIKDMSNSKVEGYQQIEDSQMMMSGSWQSFNINKYMNQQKIEEKETNHSEHSIKEEIESNLQNQNK